MDFSYFLLTNPAFISVSAVNDATTPMEENHVQKLKFSLIFEKEK